MSRGRSVQQFLEVLRLPVELPFFSNDGVPIFVLNWSFRSPIFTAQLTGGIIPLLHVSTLSGFFCLLCQAIDVVLSSPGALPCRGGEACLPLRPPEVYRREPYAPGRFDHARLVCGRGSDKTAPWTYSLRVGREASFLNAENKSSCRNANERPYKRFLIWERKDPQLEEG